MVANKDFTGFCNLSTASPSSQVCTGSETFNLNYSRRESSRMKLFQLVAFGSYIKWTAHGFLELTLWLKFGFINVDTTFRLPFKIIHECPVSVQAPTICVYQQVCKTLHIRIVPCFFSFELIFFLYQLSLPVKEKLMKIIPITERERRHTFLDISIFWNFTCKDIQAYCVKTVLKVLAIVRKANETIELCVST